MEFPSTVIPGGVIVVPVAKNLPPPRINSATFSKSPTGTHWFGVNGLSSQRSVLIYGETATQSKPSSSWHPHISLYRHRISIANAERSRTSVLRIPASTWAAMDDKFAERKQEERKIMRDVLDQRAGVLSKDCFRRPLASRVVSRFGAPRSLPNGHTYSHNGVDLRAAEGTPVTAMGSGQVSYAHAMLVPGNIVVINHGDGLFSRYLHLSKIHVKAGEPIKIGQQLGLSGATGRVEAPHLHWEVIWKGNLADPVHFLQAWEQLCGQS